MSVVTRFAPSPTGHLHLGHAYAALFAEKCARQANGRFLLRMEDIDSSRVRDEYYTAIREDLQWLGVRWDDELPTQLTRLDRYKEAIESLRSLSVLYPCFCTRKQIANELANLPSAPHGPDGAIYPGTCRNLTTSERAKKLNTASEDEVSWRLDMKRASDLAGELHWQDAERDDQIARPEQFGDIILVRKDIATSYHLSVTIDDADQGITLVTRGDDLFASTHIHRLLQALLKLPVPTWHHHRLVTDDHGQRLAKRDKARSLRELRDQGITPQEIRAQLGF